MKYKDNNDDVLMVWEEFQTDIIEYDESEDMFLETEDMDYDMTNLQNPLDWADV